jgi:hypothetical protein
MKMHQKLNDLVESWKKAGDKTDYGKKEGLPSIDYWKTVHGQNIGFIKNMEIGVGGRVGKASVEKKGYPITGNPAIRARLLGSTDQYAVDPTHSPNPATVKFVTSGYDKEMKAAFESIDKDPESLKMAEYDDAIAKTKVKASAAIDEVLSSIGKTRADFDNALEMMDKLGEVKAKSMNSDLLSKKFEFVGHIDDTEAVKSYERYIDQLTKGVPKDSEDAKEAIEVGKSVFLVNRVMHLVTRKLMRDNIEEMKKRGIGTFDTSGKSSYELDLVSDVDAYGISFSMPKKSSNQNRIIMSSITSLMAHNTAEIKGGSAESLKRVKKIMSKNKSAVVNALKQISKDYQAIVSDPNNPDARKPMVLDVSPMAGNKNSYLLTDEGRTFCSESLGKAIMGDAYDGRVMPALPANWKGSIKADKNGVKSGNFVDADNSSFGVLSDMGASNLIFARLTNSKSGDDGRFDGFFDRKNNHTNNFATANRNMISALCRRLVKDGVFTDKDAKNLLKEAATLETTNNNNVKLDFDGPNRAMYHSGQASLMLPGAWIGATTTFHEFGHFVEDNNPRLKSASARFLQKKIAGEPSQPLQRLFRSGFYGINEISHSDRMPDSYTLKAYHYAGTMDNTEVTSVGCECLSSSNMMTAIYRDNRDLFHHTIGMVTGAFAKK